MLCGVRVDAFSKDNTAEVVDILSESKHFKAIHFNSIYASSLKLWNFW